MRLAKINPDLWRYLSEIAEAEVEATISTLPDKIRGDARAIPVVYLPAPDDRPECRGLEPDTLGLFTGLAVDDTDWAPGQLTARVFLFLMNLWEFAEEDEEIYRDEICQTYLHELGHYLGLDEDGLEERGLD